MNTIILTLGVIADTSDKRMFAAFQKAADDAGLKDPAGLKLVVETLLPKILPLVQRFNLGWIEDGKGGGKKEFTEEEFTKRFLEILPLPAEKFKAAWNSMSQFGLEEEAQGENKAGAETKTLTENEKLADAMVQFQVGMWQKIASDAGIKLDEKQAKDLLPKIQPILDEFNVGKISKEAVIKQLSEVLEVFPDKLNGFWDKFTNIVIYADTNPIHYRHLSEKMAKHGLVVGKACMSFHFGEAKDKLLGRILRNARESNPEQHCVLIFGNPKLVFNDTLLAIESDKQNALMKLAKTFETASFKIDNYECAAALSATQFLTLCVRTRELNYELWVRRITRNLQNNRRNLLLPKALAFQAPAKPLSVVKLWQLLSLLQMHKIVLLTQTQTKVLLLKR